MSKLKVDRRDFLKVMGLSGAAAGLVGCDLPSTRTIEEGQEDVVSYLTPEEYAIPGVGVWYASTCLQCAAGCGTHGRVREGRVLKMEGNPDSAVAGGRLCQMGQAAIQGHYNPDRVTAPMIRDGASFKEASWDDALALINEKTAGVSGGKVAWMTRTVSGHQRTLIEAHLAAMGSKKHRVAELVNDASWRAVCKDALGTETPMLDFDKAAVVLSLGADFLGTWGSPVANARAYAKFRDAPRGLLIQAEPAMSLTGANADLWVACRPGGEAALALGVANAIIRKRQDRAVNLSAAEHDLVTSFNMETASAIAGVSGDRMVKIAGLLMERSPSLVLSGGAAQGYQAAAAAMLLNKMLGNIGQTIDAGAAHPLPDLAAKVGSTAAYADLSDDIDGGLEVLFFSGANPVFEAPKGLGLADKLGKIGFKVALAQFADETTALADVILPLHSPLEDWGTHSPSWESGERQLHLQQPLMEPVFPNTRGFGDVLLTLVKARDPGAFDLFADYYGYLRNFAANLSNGVRGGLADDDAFWNATLQKGVLTVGKGGAVSGGGALKVSAPAAYQADGGRPFHLVAPARQGLFDGRHANLPWLQEAPDQVSKIVWDSWCEMHPATAAKLGVDRGDYVRISSEHGSIETRVYVYKGVHQDVVAVPMGRGHVAYGRWATNGVNPLSVLGAERDGQTGELTLSGARVSVEKLGKGKLFAQLQDVPENETQHGRKLVATVTATRFQRTEGDA